MTYFELGFLKYAEEYGLPHSEAARLLKRATEHPQVAELFKDMPPYFREQPAETPEESPELSDMVLQDLLHQQVDQHRKSLLS